MSKIEFTYDSYSPAPYCKPQKNKVAIWQDAEGATVFSRQYMPASTEIPTSKPIIHTCEHHNGYNNTTLSVAKMIKWCCSGVSGIDYTLVDLLESRCNWLTKRDI